MNPKLANAIRNRQIIEFDYAGHSRVAEPHVYGRRGRVDQVLVYQIAGGSASGGLPGWRYMDVAGIGDLVVRDARVVKPRRAPSGEHSHWDVRYAFVK